MDRSRDIPSRYLAVRPGRPQLSAAVQIAAWGIELLQLRACHSVPTVTPTATLAASPEASPVVVAVAAARADKSGETPNPGGSKVAGGTTGTANAQLPAKRRFSAASCVERVPAVPLEKPALAFRVSSAGVRRHGRRRRRGRKRPVRGGFFCPASMLNESICSLPVISAHESGYCDTTRRRRGG
jgi:hypothetical protein